MKHNGRLADEEGRCWLFRFVKITFQHFLLIPVAYNLFFASHSFILLEQLPTSPVSRLLYFKLVRILVLNQKF